MLSPESGIVSFLNLAGLLGPEGIPLQESGPSDKAGAAVATPSSGAAWLERPCQNAPQAVWNCLPQASEEGAVSGAALVVGVRGRGPAAALRVPWWQRWGGGISEISFCS